jgi:hypothetical protein
MFVCTYQHPAPVLQQGDPGTEDNKYGFEGGTVIKIGPTYHLFTSELVGDPKVVKMRLAHWTSTDRFHFERQSTLYESSGDFTGQDERAALWSPMPRYDPVKEEWNLFYVAYRSKPNTDREWYENYEGKIWRAVSKTKGLEGIAGPYEDVGIVLRPGPDSDSWEGLQGTDSFFPFETEAGWYSFYGSAHTENNFINGKHNPEMWWGVGLVSSDSLEGPWVRCSKLNPVPLNRNFSENPVVTRLADGTYVAFFDGGPSNGTFGYSVSADGYHWPEGILLHFKPESGGWVEIMRTPLSLIAEEDGTFTVYYTGFNKDGYGCIGMISLRLSE